jgi:hypothetical protein
MVAFRVTQRNELQVLIENETVEQVDCFVYLV